MFETTNRMNLASVEKSLARFFSAVELLGELQFTAEDYRRICGIVKETLQQQTSHLEKIPDRVFLCLLVFCARYEDTSVTGFWSVFLERLGLRNDASVQNACRKRFYAVQQHLAHLYFPAEGYTCITPILFHAVIPQICVPEMVTLLRKIGQDAGWDAVAELELAEIERQLPLAAKKMGLTTAIHRFVSNIHSRRLAAKLVQDLCEAAHLHQRGIFLSQQIDCLLEERPVQREVWNQLIATAPEQSEGASFNRALFVSPRWQWDLKVRQLRLFFPRQNSASNIRPLAFVVEKERYPVNAKPKDGAWEIEPIYLSRLPINHSFKVELRAEHDTCLRSWKVTPLQEKILFFQLNPAGTLASHIPAERGLPAGEWLMLIRPNLRLCDTEGEVKPLRQWYAPRGCEEYQALSVILSPPLQVFATNDEEEAPERIPLAEEAAQSLRLEGKLLPEADDPSGTATFTGAAPDVLLTAQSWDEIKNLQLQLRDLTATSESVAQLYSLQSLRHSDIAVWSETQTQLQIQLSNLLPEGAIGRFRLKLLRGLQSARYLPLEFNLIPILRSTPSTEEFDRTLYTVEEPPEVQIGCRAPHQLTSKNGHVTDVLPGLHRIQWSGLESDFAATLDFGHFRLPLRWHPHLLRARIQTKTSGESWEGQPFTLPLEQLSFGQWMRIEGIPEAEFQLFAGEVLIARSRFEASAGFQFPLAHFTDYVKRSATQQVPIRIVVKQNQCTHTLPLLVVTKKSAGRADLSDGEPIRYIRVGQQVFHPDYGLGALEAFVETVVGEEAISTALFNFDRYAGVRFFIPVNRHLPVYGSRQTASTISSSSTPRSRKFVVGEQAKEIAFGEPLSSLGGQL